MSTIFIRLAILVSATLVSLSAEGYPSFHATSDPQFGPVGFTEQIKQNKTAFNMYQKISVHGDAKCAVADASMCFNKSDAHWCYDGETRFKIFIPRDLDSFAISFISFPNTSYILHLFYEPIDGAAHDISFVDTHNQGMAGGFDGWYSELFTQGKAVMASLGNTRTITFPSSAKKYWSGHDGWLYFSIKEATDVITSHFGHDMGIPSESITFSGKLATARTQTRINELLSYVPSGRSEPKEPSFNVDPKFCSGKTYRVMGSEAPSGVNQNKATITYGLPSKSIWADALRSKMMSGDFESAITARTPPGNTQTNGFSVCADTAYNAVSRPYYPNSWQHIALWYPAGGSGYGFMIEDHPNTNLRVHYTVIPFSHIDADGSSDIGVHHSVSGHTRELMINNAGTVVFDDATAAEIDSGGGAWVLIDILMDRTNPNFIPSENQSFPAKISLTQFMGIADIDKLTAWYMNTTLDADGNPAVRPRSFSVEEIEDATLSPSHFGGTVEGLAGEGGMCMEQNCRTPKGHTYSSASKGYLIDHMLRAGAFDESNVAVTIDFDDFVLSDTYSMFDKKRGELYFPHGFRHFRMYFPSGISQADWLLVGYPNTDFLAFATFVPDKEQQGEGYVIDHTVTDLLGIKPMRTGSTVSTLIVNGGGISLDPDMVNTAGGGWLYVDLVEDIQDPRHVAQGEHYDMLYSAAPWVSMTQRFTTTTPEAAKAWMSRTRFYGCGGDPAENPAPITVVDRKLPGTVTREKLNTFGGTALISSIELYMQLHPDAGSGIPGAVNIQKETVAGSGAIGGGLVFGDNGHLYNSKGWGGIPSLSESKLIEAMEHHHIGDRIGFTQTYDIAGQLTRSGGKTHKLFIEGTPTFCKTYIPPGSTAAQLAFMGDSKPKRAYITFVGENEKGRAAVLDATYYNPASGQVPPENIQYLSGNDSGNLLDASKPTTQFAFSYGGTVDIDAQTIASKGGGWLYVALLGESVLQHKNLSTLKATVMSTFTLGTEPDKLISQIKWLSPCGGDPGDTAGSLSLIYPRLEGDLSFGAALAGSGTQHYDDYDDYYHGKECGDGIDDKTRDNLLSGTATIAPGKPYEGNFGVEALFVHREQMTHASSLLESDTARRALWQKMERHTRRLVPDAVAQLAHTCKRYEQTAEANFLARQCSDLILSGADAATVSAAMALTPPAR